MSGPTDIAGKIKDVTAALAKADAELKWEMAATAADVAGMVDPTPVSDLVGAGLSLRKGDFLGAGLSVASMVPYVGDALAKPVKAVRATKAVIAIEKKIAGLTKTLNGLRKAEKEAQAVEAAAKEAKTASEAAAKAKPPKSKEAAEQQQTAAKDGKAKDCEDCGTASSTKKDKDNDKPKKVSETKVPCFHPYDKKKFKSKTPAQQEAYLKEMSKQLRRQEDAVNQFSADEYKAARDLFASGNRNPLAKSAQADARDLFAAKLRRNMTASLQDKLGLKAARVEAAAATKRVMAKLAALHEPDMVAGGWMDPTPKGMGRSDVNSSIGGSWNQDGRVAAMDKAAANAIEAGNGSQKMNVKLEICRGKGQRNA